MPELICDTSPLQYLHQLGLLHVLPSLVGKVLVPPAVAREIETGTALGVDLPDLGSKDWIVIRAPAATARLPLVADLGKGETEVLALALETGDAVVALDDALARRAAEDLHIPLRGTLGLLLDAKKAGLVSALRPLLDELRSLGFRLAERTRAVVLRSAGED